VEEAIAAKEALHNKKVPQITLQPEIPVRIEFAEVLRETAREPQEATYMKNVSVSDTARVVLPGLVLLENFVSEEEERMLVAEGDSRDWQQLKARRVLQFGFEFSYLNRNVDSASPIDPFPAPFREVANRISSTLEVRVALSYFLSSRPASLTGFLLFH